jgi:hypothetical protein
MSTPSGYPPAPGDPYPQYQQSPSSGAGYGPAYDQTYGPQPAYGPYDPAATGQYDQTGGYEAVPPPPARSRRGPLLLVLILIGVLLLLGVGGLTTFLVLRNAGGDAQASPAAATTSFLTAVYKDKDAAKANRYVCAAARDTDQLTRKIDEIRRYEQKFNRDPTFTWDEPKIESSGKGQAKLAVTVRFATNDDRVAEEKLRITAVDDGGWFVCDVQTVS